MLPGLAEFAALERAFTDSETTMAAQEMIWSRLGLDTTQDMTNLVRLRHMTCRPWTSKKE